MENRKIKVLIEQKCSINTFNLFKLFPNYVFKARGIDLIGMKSCQEGKTIIVIWEGLCSHQNQRWVVTKYSCIDYFIDLEELDQFHINGIKITEQEIKI